jgi:foldase protein PrsA
MRTRRFIVSFSLALVAAAALVACGSTKKNDVPAGAVAIVGNEPIPRSELDSLMAQAKVEYEQNKTTYPAGFPAVGSKSYQSLQDRAVAYLVRRSASMQQATKMGIKVTSAAVDSNLKQMIKQQYKGSQKKYEADLEKAKVTEQQLKERIRENLVNEKVYAALVAHLTVSTGDIKDYYNSHKGSYKVGESRAVSHILLKTKAKADSVYKQLNAGANFAKLAKKDSFDQNTKNVGGKLGSLEKTTMLAKPFANVLFGKLETGTYSKPVKTTFGWHIIYPTGPITKAHLKPLSEVSTTIRQTLLSTKQSAAVTSWVKKAEKYAVDNTNYASGFAPTTTTSSSTVATTTTS